MHPLLLSCTLLVYLYISSSIFFDIVHYYLHQWSNSRWRALKWLADCHRFHHLYYNRSLNFNQRYLRQNSWIALPLEMVCLSIGGLLGWLSFLPLTELNNGEVEPTPLIIVTTIHFVRTLVVISMSGRDSNHVVYDSVPKDPYWFFVGPQFHALHHLYPDRYMSSVIKLFDWVVGTAYSLQNKTVAMTGGSGAFGAAIKRQLQSEGVQNIYTLKFGADWTYTNFSQVGSVLEKADILILAHGTKEEEAMDANCDSSIRLIRMYMERRASREGVSKTMPEIWYVGSEIELHPAFGGPAMQRYCASKRAFLPYARALYDNPQILYRHIVPAAFKSRMSNAIVSPQWAARVTMWWVRRGARYVPVTYTGIAYLNFFKFICWVYPDMDMGHRCQQ